MIARCRRTGPLAGLVIAWLLPAVAGCAGPAPKLFPVAPMSCDDAPDGHRERRFDTDHDGRIDFIEREGGDGIVSLLRYDDDGDGIFEHELPGPAALSDDVPHVLIVLDSIPFDLVRETWKQGRFRAFHPPGRIISPFPVMTDLCVAEFLGVSPSRAVESQYYNGKHLNSGYGTYARETISHWHDAFDYHLMYASHFVVYFWPNAWFDHELRRIQEHLLADSHDRFFAYVVGTSAIGAQLGHDGHRAGLVRLDRFCQWLIHRYRGRLHITLMSDHGHNDVLSRWIDLRESLREMGYRVTDRLERPGDVVVPAYGMVTYAGIHSAEPQRVAADVAGLDGVDLAAFRDDADDVVVLGREGRARISRKGDRYRYAVEQGDPLDMIPILDRLARGGNQDPEGFVDDDVLFEATVDHQYPDAIHRLWRAFHGLTEHTPDVLLSIADGYHCGSAFMSKLIDLRSAHGGLSRLSSSGFVMTTTGPVDPVIRMEDLREALIDLGVPLDPPRSQASGEVAGRR